MNQFAILYGDRFTAPTGKMATAKSAWTLPSLWTPRTRRGFPHRPHASLSSKKEGQKNVLTHKNPDTPRVHEGSRCRVQGSGFTCTHASCHEANPAPCTLNLTNSEPCTLHPEPQGHPAQSCRAPAPAPRRAWAHRARPACAPEQSARHRAAAHAQGRPRGARRGSGAGAGCGGSRFRVQGSGFRFRVTCTHAICHEANLAP